MSKYTMIKKRFVESTAVTALALPVYAGLETMVADMSWEVSLKSRIGALFLNYLIVPIAMKGRETSKKIFDINKKGGGKLKSLHDGLYVAGGCLLIKPAIYVAAGETDVKKIIIGTLATMVAGAILGPLGLYLVDTFKDLTNVEPFERAPKWLKNKEPSFKKKVAAGFLAASIALTGLIYTLVPKKTNQEIVVPTKQGQVIEASIKNNSGLENIMEK